MPKFRVIRTHDGIPAGTIKSLPDSHLTRYMVETGLWEVVSEKPVRARKNTKTSK